MKWNGACFICVFKRKDKNLHLKKTIFIFYVTAN